ncbi:MAG: hypothetical protein K6L81_12875 [Agarilytica sp.]
MENKPYSFGCSKQRGAILVVSMIILLIMTMIGASSMRSSGVQMKMVNNQNIRQKVFQSAEKALTIVEDEIVSDGHDTIFLQLVQDSCTDSCYNVNCAGGLCFSGEYPDGSNEPSCTLGGSSLPYWKDNNVWEDEARHLSLSVGDDTLDDVKYIKEFMCYTDKSDSSDCSLGNEVDCAALFRVTALATSEDQRSKVMLQSTVRVVYQ